MGGGSYSFENRSIRASAMSYDTKSTHEIFTERSVNLAMNPKGVKVRESRDSKEHPNSLAILLALDVTGSMGSIPTYLVKEGLPHTMEAIIKGGINDPQVLFTGIGDHECDSAPLQVGQFESSDELLDHWLTKLYLEGGGGGNDGESYLLAWYFAAKHTSMDCFEKRKEKGFLFTIGDEPVLNKVPSSALKKIMGDAAGEYKNWSAVELLDEARKTYNVYHLNILQGADGSNARTLSTWKELLGDNLINVKKREDVSKIIAEVVCKGASKQSKSEAKKEETAIIL